MGVLDWYFLGVVLSLRKCVSQFFPVVFIQVKAEL
jgi:hypothetical protein